MKEVGGMAYLTADEMRQVDQEATELYGLDVVSLMENAGLLTATLAKRMLGDLYRRRIACLAGKGNNGGDGLVAARHLADWGADVTVVLAAAPEDFGGVPARQLTTVGKMGLKVESARRDLSGFDLLVDALLGYSAKGDPREPLAGIIKAADRSGVPTLSVDLPSGLDPTSGEPGNPCISAEATITLAFPKLGFLSPAAKKHVGQLYLGDVSIPTPIYRRFSMVPPFGVDTILRLW